MHREISDPNLNILMADKFQHTEKSRGVAVRVSDYGASVLSATNGFFFYD